MNWIDPSFLETGDFPPVPPPVPVSRIRTRSAARSHVGRVRSNNEDHYLIARLRREVELRSTNLLPDCIPMLPEEHGYVFAVADGMGGMASGEEASQLAIIAGLELVRGASRWHLDATNPTEIDDLIEACRRYVQQINRRVYEKASSHPSMEGMGTTLSVAYSIGLRLFVIHVGDSRVYLYRGDALGQITEDHTVAQDLARTGEISPSEVKSHRKRNVLTNYIGSPGECIEAEVHRLDLVGGDRLLLCSDGLTDLVDDDRIATILGEEPEPEAACDRLIEEALDAGGRDNVTVVVARFDVESD